MASAMIRPDAQSRSKFDAAKYEGELEQHVATEAALTPTEAAAFFPVYKEMQAKKRMLYHRMRTFRHIDTQDEKACLDAIRTRDDLAIQIKQLQRQYHARFCEILPAGKVVRIIRAEERFHRRALRSVAKRK